MDNVETKNTKNESNITALPEEVLDDILEDVPEEHRKKVEKFIVASSVQMRGMISPEASVMNKITEDHITEYLQGARQEMENSFDERKQNRLFTFITLIVAMIFFIIIILLLKDMPDFMEKIIYSLVSLIAGAIGGYGYGKTKSDNE